MEAGGVVQVQEGADAGCAAAGGAGLDAWEYNLRLTPPVSVRRYQKDQRSPVWYVLN